MTSLVIFTVLIFIAESLIRSKKGSGILPYGLLSLLFLVVATAWSLAIIRFRYISWWFEVRQEELYLERGVFNRIKTVVPYVRIQHLDVQQGIIERWFHLGRLVVYTAGSKGGEIVIPGLPFHYAEQLRDEFKAKILIEDEV